MMSKNGMLKKFLAEKIKGRWYYEIKWKGFKETTWEPRSNLIKDIPELILDFENVIKSNRQFRH